ncbi:FHA domain-containing protein [Paenibacillus sp. P96]|uniref:FHA domain-containing protein n=1 Tax=Paenibacillus zeirhizosphaerae TaxID=2987519 RepID=A0ABT9FKM9_9BACL|nr:DUF6382 domain-containing protein [Paenibacillus sp. P96]MDP4095286.1 FHA domain-containing protein [Paenibacillus sp. P96]
MFGLQRDFALNGGTFMIVKQEPDFRVTDLNPVQSGMVTSNRIQGLLGVMVKEVDFRIELQYDITGQRMLSHLWKNGNISMSLFYEVIYRIADTLHNCGQYMLDINRFILHEEYMFISESERSRSVSLTYVPVRRNLYEGTAGAQLKQLIIRMISCVSELEGDGVQRILQVCDGELFNPGKLKEVLLQYIHPETGTRTKGNVHSHGATESGEDVNADRKPQVLRARQDNSSIQEKDLDKPSSAANILPIREPGSYTAFTTANKREEPDDVSEDEEEDGYEPETALYKYRLYIALGCLLGAAVIWKYVYLEAPSTIRLLICALITAGMAALALIAWQGWSLTGWFRRGQDLDPEDIPDEEASEPAGPLRRRFRFSSEREDEGQEPWRWSVQEKAPQPEYRRLDVEEANRYNTFEEVHDVPDSPLSPATTLLQDKRVDIPSSVRPGAYLRRVAGKSDPAENIPVSSGSFIIGRSQEIAQYVEDTEGVSRSHVELSLNGSGHKHVLKDLASTNGTRLNGDPMVPYKEYPLDDGDTFELAGVAYTYYAA